MPIDRKIRAGSSRKTGLRADDKPRGGRTWTRLASLGFSLGMVIMFGCTSGMPVEVHKPLPALIADLRSGRPQARYNAAYTLNVMDLPPQECVAPLVDAIKQERYENIRAMMLSALSHAAPTNPEIVPATINLLKFGTEDEALFAAVEILGMLGAPAAERTVPALIAALDNPRCGQKVPFALEMIGPAARPASTVLARTLSPEDHSRPWLLRSSVADALVAIDAPAEIAVPALRGYIERGYGIEAERCAAALGHYGASAASAVPALIRLIDANPGNDGIDVRQYATESLGRIGPLAAAAIPSVIRSLKDENPGVRQAAAKAFEGLGPAARTAVPNLIAALDDPDQLVMCFAAKSLGVLATNEPGVIEALTRKLDTSIVHDIATKALGQIRERNRDALVPQKAKSQ